MQSDSVMLAGVLNVLKSANKLTKVGEPNHIYLISIDGTPLALQKIRGLLGALSGVLLLDILQNVLTLSQVPAFWINSVYGVIILFSLVLARIAGGAQDT